VTDRDELRQIKNSPRYYTFTNRWGARRGMGHCNIGVLASPFMRAALVIDVDPDAATASRIRPAASTTTTCTAISPAAPSPG
jgi:hypothetical protein